MSDKRKTTLRKAYDISDTIRACNTLEAGAEIINKNFAPDEIKNYTEADKDNKDVRLEVNNVICFEFNGSNWYVYYIDEEGTFWDTDHYFIDELDDAIFE